MAITDFVDFLLDTADMAAGVSSTTGTLDPLHQLIFSRISSMPSVFFGLSLC